MGPSSSESRAVLWVRRGAIIAAFIHIVLFMWSIYRRIWQVQHVEARSASTVLAPGSAVGYDVITSGEAQNLIRLELVQGDRTRVLREERSRVSEISAYDPRLFRSAPWVTLTQEQLSGFHAGRATLRVTVFGGRKLLRTPPPRVSELQVPLVKRL